MKRGSIAKDEVAQRLKTST